MALSAEEHVLLVSTCENMNVAANTCREVLEMLRSLGNTGVVDIATHNNTSGAHSNDTTLVHSSIVNGVSTIGFSSKKTSMPKMPFTVRTTETWGMIEINAPTMGTNAEVPNDAGIGLYNYLTDTEATRVAYANDTSGRTYSNLGFLSAQLIDAEDKKLAGSVTISQGKRAVWSSDNGTNKYVSITFKASSGNLNDIRDLFEMSSGGLVPLGQHTLCLGNSTYDFKDLFILNSPTVTSDRRAKKDVADIGNACMDFIKYLHPVKFKFIQNSGNLSGNDGDGNPIQNSEEGSSGVRTHWGFVAQEVKEAMTQAGVEDAAVWCLADKNNPDSKQMLRYEELIAPLVKAVQILAAKVEALEGRAA